MKDKRGQPKDAKRVCTTKNSSELQPELNHQKKKECQVQLRVRKKKGEEKDRQESSEKTLPWETKKTSRGKRGKKETRLGEFPRNKRGKGEKKK